jgi:hypothetical protein
MKRTALALLAAGVVAASILVSLPPPTTALAVDSSLPPTVRGAYHIHTRRSDGTGTPDTVAAAAARAGLKFVILADHADAASQPTAPYYRSGVLIIEAVEISTDGGHLVALGLPRAPYPLAGEPRDVIEDVRRLGGFSIVAHPESAKSDLRWHDWDQPFDALEWLSGDSEWRDESAAALGRALLTYPFRHPETLAGLLDRPEPALRQWDILTAQRPVVALAAADAHARIALRSGEPDDASPALHLPSYESMFRTFTIAASPLTLAGNAADDARAVIEAIRRGRVYSSIDALATPAVLSFSAVDGETTIEGGEIIPRVSREIELRVASNAPPGARVVIVRDGTPHTTADGPALRLKIPAERGVYRAEIQLVEAPGEPPVPWVVSNPIYVGYEPRPAPPPRPPAKTFSLRREDSRPAEWKAESSPRSKVALDVPRTVDGTQLSLRWGLGGTQSESPFAALTMPSGRDIGDYDRLMFTARADRPMRLSVQVRVPTGGDGERWHRSVYLDETARPITIFFDEMTPRGMTSTRGANLAGVDTLMFVVDTVNTKSGSSGQFWIDDVRYAR